MDESSTQVTSKRELLERIDSAWNDLQDAIDGFSPEQLTGAADAGGWTAKDHLAHLAAWENSMVFLLQGQPRHEGLGVSESTYLTSGEDGINDEIFRKNRDLDLAGTLARHSMIHINMLALLANLTDSDLRKTYTDYLPEEPGTEDGSPILNRVFGNTAHHFDMHRAYIERLIAG